jgi:hypothetical protein
MTLEPETDRILHKTENKKALPQINTDCGEISSIREQSLFKRLS